LGREWFFSHASSSGHHSCRSYFGQRLTSIRKMSLHCFLLPSHCIGPFLSKKANRQSCFLVDARTSPRVAQPGAPFSDFKHVTTADRRSSLVKPEIHFNIDQHSLAMPYFEDASVEFRAALTRFDFEDSTPQQREHDVAIVLSAARNRDALTLWYLLARVDDELRVLVYNRLSQFVPPVRKLRKIHGRGKTELLDPWASDADAASCARSLGLPWHW